MYIDTNTVALSIGLAALAKVLIAMEDGAIPANLHFTTPNPDIPGLSDGRLKVVTERTAWNGGYVAINSFGFGGSNVHALMQSNTKVPAAPHTAANAQRLCTYAGRTQQGLENTLTKMHTEHAHNVEAHALLQETSVMPASSHPYRGYTILNKEPAVQEVQVGSQKLLSLPSAIVRCLYDGFGAENQATTSTLKNLI